MNSAPLIHLRNNIAGIAVAAGEVPYEQGFTIPKKIPTVIGQTTLAKFSDAAQLNAYIRAAMPFWKLPGSLTESSRCLACDSLYPASE